MEKRDPRTEPKRGDVLIAPGRLRLEVTGVTKKLVMYKLVSLRPLHAIDGIPMVCNHPLSAWLKIVKQATVTYAAE